MGKTAIFCSGVAVGVIGVKIYPKTKVVKYAKFAVAIIKAQGRLSKILIDEYWRIDEAIDTEQKFLNMISPNDFLKVTFSVIDEYGQRKLHVSMKTKSTDQEGN